MENVTSAKYKKLFVVLFFKQGFSVKELSNA